MSTNDSIPTKEQAKILLGDWPDDPWYRHRLVTECEQAGWLTSLDSCTVRRITDKGYIALQRWKEQQK